MPPSLGITNEQLKTQLAAVTTRLTAAEVKLNSTAGSLAALTARVATLESSGGGSAELAALKARMDAIEAKTCPQESRIAAIEADHIPDA